MEEDKRGDAIIKLTEEKPSENKLDTLFTPETIENYRVEKIKELRKFRHVRNLVRSEKLLTQRQIINFNARKKDLEIAEDKANNVIGDLLLEIELARTKFHQVRL